MGGRLSPAARLEEFKAALWLEPTNPFARDLYAQTLFHQHQSSAALRQITKAVFFSPSLDTHFYLAPRFIPRLSGAERKAVVDGFNMAIAHKYVGAVDALGGFYYAAGRFADEGRVYSGAAAAAADPAAREDYLLAAGAAYGRAGDYAEAEAALRGAMLAEPADLTSYEYLIKFVFTPRKDLAGAQALVKQGIAAGADPYGLNLSLAEIAQSVGDMKAARNALEQAHAVRPSGFDAVWQLGGLYLAARQFAQAIPWLRKAAGIRPDSADVFYNLARAEELDYDYAGADKAYARAVGLAPQNQEFKLQYEQFKRNLSQSDRNSD
jgi:tetratricopeptide (TPR) repeat protein